MKSSIFLTIVLFSCLSACKFKGFASSGGAELKGEAITFLVPTETSSSTSGTGGITYEGDTVKAETNGKNLTVNGNDYGALSSGDVVDL